MYSKFTGSGPVTETEWSKVCSNFTTTTATDQTDTVSMRTFIEMHQREAESYGPNHNLAQMWRAVKELGHNRKFFASTVCPIIVKFEVAEGSFLMGKEYRVVQLKSGEELMVALDEYFWAQSITLPYGRGLSSLRQFKTDYFAALVAGPHEESINYYLDLSKSKNVNLDVERENLTIISEVPKDTIKVLAVAIAQADSWFLSVRQKNKETSNDSVSIASENTNFND